MDTSVIEAQVNRVIATREAHQIDHALMLVRCMTFTDEATCELLTELEERLEDTLADIQLRDALAALENRIDKELAK